MCCLQASATGRALCVAQREALSIDVEKRGKFEPRTRRSSYLYGRCSAQVVAANPILLFFRTRRPLNSVNRLYK